MDAGNNFEQCGSGSPIVFIHGSFASTSTWKKMIDQLSASHHCISIKLPGHCGTPDPDDFSNPSIETELSMIERVVRELTDEPVHLVGHSYGGVVALALALKGSLTLSRVTLYEPVAVWVLDAVNDVAMTDSVQRFLEQYRNDVSSGAPFACGQVINFWGGDGAFEPLPDFIKNSMDLLVSNNIRHWDICTAPTNNRDDLNNFAIPTSLVCGSKSNPVAHAITDHLTREIPLSEKHVIEGASHFLVTSHADECLSVIQNPATGQ